MDVTFKPRTSFNSSYLCMHLPADANACATPQDMCEGGACNFRIVTSKFRTSAAAPPTACCLAGRLPGERPA